MKTRQKTPSNFPQYLTAPEVAAILRTSRKAIYTMIERRQLPGVTRIGRRVLIHERSLLDWLRGRQQSVREVETSHG